MSGMSMPTNGFPPASAAGTGGASGGGGGTNSGGSISMVGGTNGNPLHVYQQQLQASQVALSQNPSYTQGKV